MNDIRKGDIVKQKNNTVIDIYGEVLIEVSYNHNHMIVNFGKGNVKEVPKNRFEVVFRR